jgi:hypothetical protein
MRFPNFVDTSGLYALLDRDEAGHVSALAWLQDVHRGIARGVTTDYVITETAELLVARRRKVLLPLLFETASASAGLGIEWIGPERFSRARDLMLAHRDKDYSFTDCTSFVVMRELGLRIALTKDKHFRQAGFRALLA